MYCKPCDILIHCPRAAFVTEELKAEHAVVKMQLEKYVQKSNSCEKM